MWQAMLMAVNLPPSKQIIIDGFITGEGGIKMSKSLGNTVDPVSLVNEYGVDALRYFVAGKLAAFEDSAFTPDKFKEAYNAYLANGLGNLASRVLRMSETNDVKVDLNESHPFIDSQEFNDIKVKYNEGFDKFDLLQACEAVWQLIANTDGIVEERQPFKTIKTDPKKAIEDIKELVVRLYQIGKLLLPILPKTAEKIIELVEKNKIPAEPLFIRK